MVVPSATGCLLKGPGRGALAYPVHSLLVVGMTHQVTSHRAKGTSNRTSRDSAKESQASRLASSRALGVGVGVGWVEEVCRHKDQDGTGL